MSKSAMLPSKLFNRGDLAVTVNSRAPLLNNGHIVRIVEVLGPMPERDIEFGYGIERIDGQPFVLVVNKDSKLPEPGKKRAIAHWWQLRPLLDNYSLAEGRVTSLDLEASQ
jgi:hypothetical protein